MKFERTDRFQTDWQRLVPGELARFRAAVRRFHAAAVAYRRDPRAGWPDSLRVRPMTSAPGVWEMTWSFAGPDGRATFEWIDVGGEPAVRWRRLGGHTIFRDP